MAGDFQTTAFDLAISLSVLLYAVIALGLSASAPRYLAYLHTGLKLYIGAFLIWRFNPYRVVRFTELDSKIAFNAGIFLMASTVVSIVGHEYWWIQVMSTMGPVMVDALAAIL